MSNAKLLSRAAEIIQAGCDVREADGEVWDTARFEKACLDWLQSHRGENYGIGLCWDKISKDWCVCRKDIWTWYPIAYHKHSHVALAKAVVAVSKQEKTT